MSFVRGDIHWVRFPDRQPRGAEIEKDRPCIIVSHREASVYRKTVVGGSAHSWEEGRAAAHHLDCLGRTGQQSDL